MIVIEYHDIELDYCTDCKGVWFDSGELELLLDSHGLEAAGRFLGNTADLPEAATPEKKRKCPICGRKMKKVNIGEPPLVLIDVCGKEHGVWFDGGEVTQLLRHLASEPAATGGSRELVMSFIEDVFQAQEPGGG